MTEYPIIYTQRARRDLKKIPLVIAHEIINTIRTLRYDPLIKIKKLQGSSKYPFYSLHVSDYRVIMIIQNNRLIVQVVETGPRKTISRRY